MSNSPPQSQFLNILHQTASIKKTETILPITGKTVYMTPLVIGDDLALRTSLISPVGYDRELLKLIAKHMEFQGEDRQISVDDLAIYTSNVDKLSLIWAMMKATYESYSEKEEIQCLKCKHKMNVDIEMDELIHEDTYTLWDKVDDDGNPILFTIYSFPITIDSNDNDTVYEFETKLPSIKDNNDLLSIISTDEIQYNLETLKSIFTQTQNIALLTNKLTVSSKTDQFESVSTTTKYEIMSALENFIPKFVAKQFFDEYGLNFDKYVPKFYKSHPCEKCGTPIKHDIDLEISLFRKSLLD